KVTLNGLWMRINPLLRITEINKIERSPNVEISMEINRPPTRQPIIVPMIRFRLLSFVRLNPGRIKLNNVKAIQKPWDKKFVRLTNVKAKNIAIDERIAKRMTGDFKVRFFVI